jgi:hypothetical protein
MNKRLGKSRQIKYEGDIKIGDLSLSCYVLEDGTRVLSGRGLQTALKLVDEPEQGIQTAGNRIDRYLGQKSLQPFIYKGRSPDHFNPIECYKGDSRINGYEATLLADICDAFLEARKNIKLSSRQEIIADQCEILIRGFAKVGIIALIDEATGYQYDRERFELQKILDSYISEEVARWQLTFTIDFYKNLFRLWEVPFTEKSVKSKPQFVGNLTVKYIYNQLPEVVIDKIKELNPKSDKGKYKYKWHQLLTDDIGREHLKKQINEVIALMSVSDSKADFIRLFNKRYSRDYQLEFDFAKEVRDWRELSEFDKNLSKALDYNGD